MPVMRAMLGMAALSLWSGGGHPSGGTAVSCPASFGKNCSAMTTHKHPHSGPDHPKEHDHKSPIEARLEARIAHEREHGAGKTAAADPALAEANNRYLRLAADFENYKRRTRQEQLGPIPQPAAEPIGR